MRKEILLNTTDLLVSETDKNGIIVSANSDFLRISEYSLEELLNKSHNILRDEEMPASVFEELWKRIEKGEIWSGYIKNRSKSGNYYWVHAVVSSLRMDDGSVGYISCRKKASRKKIEEMQKLYKDMS